MRLFNCITLLLFGYLTYAQTDFKIYEESVKKMGGLHVILTYLPKNESDFIQVKGRTARQG